MAVRSFRLTDDVSKAISDHALAFGGNMTEALEDMITMSNTLGGLSLLSVHLPDGRTGTLMQTPKVYSIMMRNSKKKGEYIAEYKYSQSQFNSMFYLYNGSLWQRGCHGDTMPEGAIYLGGE